MKHLVVKNLRKDLLDLKDLNHQEEVRNKVNLN